MYEIEITSTEHPGISLRKDYNVTEINLEARYEADLQAEIDRRSQPAVTAPVSAAGLKTEPEKASDPLEGAFVLVKGGSFTMGCLPERDGTCESYETAYQVALSDYYMGETEVTQAQWRAVTGNNPSRFSGCDQCPVEQVSWEDVQEFIYTLNQKSGKRYRLPSEAEWEYAARGGNQSKNSTYAGGPYVGVVAWYDGNSEKKTHPVKAKVANELGLYDMSGNVWEWCQDWLAKYPDSRQTNPTGPASGSFRVLRGGSWFSVPTYFRVALRFKLTPDNRNHSIGFRLARTP